MPKRSRKTSDPVELARSIVDQVTGISIPEKEPEKVKNPAAVALGRLGGLRGGPARAAKLTKKQLKESASKAAKARWHKKP